MHEPEAAFDDPAQQLQEAWSTLHDARARLFRQDVSAEERIALRAEIGRLSQEIRRLQWQEAIRCCHALSHTPRAAWPSAG